MLWLSMTSKSAYPRTYWPAAGLKACSSCPLSLELVAGLGPYCHSHGCGGSEQWACRLEYDRLLHSLPFRGIAEGDCQGCSPKSVWLARCWYTFMPATSPKPQETQFPTLLNVVFVAAPLFDPTGFFFSGLHLPDWSFWYLTPAFVALKCSLMGCLVLVWDTVPCLKDEHVVRSFCFSYSL